MGRTAEAEELFKRSLQLRRDPGNDTSLSTKLNLALLYGETDRDNLAIDLYEGALSALRNTASPIELAIQRDYLAQSYGRLGQNRKAVALFEADTAILERELPPTDRQLIIHYRLRGEQLFREANFSNAREYFRRSIAVYSNPPQLMRSTSSGLTQV